MRVSVRTEIAIPVGRPAVPAIFYSFDGFPPGQEHFLVALGPFQAQEPTLVRIHSECITGDLFDSQRCDCGPQLQEAIQRFHEDGGYIVYLRQEGRGIGLYAKLDAYALQDTGLDTYEANRHLNYPDDLRAYAPAAEMLRAVGVTRMRLLTNNPQKVEDLRASGLEVAEVVPTGVFVNDINSRYLQTKIAHARHTMRLADAQRCASTGEMST
jgi:GTP cyclohydrolase II